MICDTCWPSDSADHHADAHHLATEPSAIRQPFTRNALVWRIEPPPAAQLKPPGPSRSTTAASAQQGDDGGSGEGDIGEGGNSGEGGDGDGSVGTGDNGAGDDDEPHGPQTEGNSCATI